MIDTAVDGKTAPTGSVQASAFNAAVVETLTPGTDEDENLAWVDPTQWDQDYQQATGNQVPPYTDSDIKPGTVLTSSSNPVLTCVDNDTPADFQADGADYTVRSTWHEVDNALAAMRNGWYNPTTTKGWGYYKVVGKHNLTTKIVRFVTKHPYSQRYLGALSWNYTSYNVYHIKCSGWGPLRRCKSVARTQVVVGHNFTALSDRIPKGVITAYCKGYDGKCPSWVKNAINVP
jgi:hypothetical protein